MNVFFLKEFEDHRDADDAVYELNGKELLGERYAQKCVRSNSSNTLIRANYPTHKYHKSKMVCHHIGRNLFVCVH